MSFGLIAGPCLIVNRDLVLRIADEGLVNLAEVRERFWVPVLTDIHDGQQSAVAAQAVVCCRSRPSSASRPTSLRLPLRPWPAHKRW